MPDDQNAFVIVGDPAATRSRWFWTIVAFLWALITALHIISMEAIPAMYAGIVVLLAYLLASGDE